MRTPAEPPTLNELERNPGAFDALSPDARLAVLERAEVLVARLRVRALGASPPPPAPASAPSAERALRVPEAAQMLGMSKDYVHRQWRRLGGYKDADGRVKFIAGDLRRRLDQMRRTAAPVAALSGFSAPRNAKGRPGP